MKNYKYWFQLFTLVTVIWFSSMGCVTKNLWKNTNSKPYAETIIAFYSHPQKNEIIFIGQKYHYIFNQGTSELNEVLKVRELLGLNQKNLSINTYTDADNGSTIHTDIRITFEEQSLNKQQRLWLTSHNFLHPALRVPVITKSFSLTGKRYKANSKVNNHAIKLQLPIKLQVYEHSSNTLYKILMTPLTVTADAGLALAGAIIFPIMLIAE